jgi:hypothetical protein
MAELKRQKRDVESRLAVVMLQSECVGWIAGVG